MKTTQWKIAILAANLTTLTACTAIPTTGSSQTPLQAAVSTDTTVNETVNLTPAESPVAQQQYVVQLTASASAVKAEGIKNRFAGEGYQAFVSPLMIDDKLLHRVQIGYYNQEHDAKSVLAHLQQHYPDNRYVADAVVKTP